MNGLNVMQEDKLPETFEEAVEFVSKRIDINNAIKSPYFHFTVGMSIRNRLGLWNINSPLYKDMLVKFGLCHADDTYHIIVRAAHAKVNNSEYDPQDDVDNFKEYWIKKGINPSTMEEL